VSPKDTKGLAGSKGPQAKNNKKSSGMTYGRTQGTSEEDNEIDFDV